MTFTPRRIVALIAEHERARRYELADALSIQTLAARGEEKELKKRHEELTA